MIDLHTWKPAAKTALWEAFGERLLCLGLQGSYLRGEATADSDIDLLVVLDRVTIDDLDTFHAAMHSMPDGGRAVGFTCGRAELAAWPAYELYQFEHGTEVWLGDLHALLPEYGGDDIRLGARISVANLYHMVNHTYLTMLELDESAQADALKALLKGFFFSLQIVHAVRTGIFVPTKRQLLTEAIDEDERTLLRHAMPNTPPCPSARSCMIDANASETLYGLLQSWCSRTLVSLPAD
ncbi:nucleotidyltransferase domain-containing protein [Bifidobacterium pullorum subsp. saeculare DSM 6531 = LMG 14934]|uniref:Nucleotidyltransferase domain-containing protein n=1 Tax=Bifidobacterium pullorum subsp. saeculare DSM 6531 = LMG 14934 TaxID=1437611 RepID=A0A087CS76_9BIFI|nr:nucleotidyltransferase domain-containing protein [Bifidobacterium pullorum]KFI86126.1 nucleotidyltransferase domain-containing protein [Bifidobacterium pullorum subsp. saeculare DSM 6531 = LMG 14934]